jgi:two-component system cell cycle sensor histidine kinase/response regulator CckA
MTFPDPYRSDYEFIVRSVHGILWEADADTWRVTFVSESAEQILGFSVEEWRSEGFWMQQIHPEDREWVARACRKATVEGMHLELDYRMIAADGRTVWFRDAFLVDMEDGRPVRLRGMLIDISEQKESAQALRTSEQLVRLFASSAQDAIFRYSNEPMRCEYMSPAVTHITGYTPEEYYADPYLLWNIVHPQDQHLLTTSALMAPGGEPVTLRIIRKDAHVIWAEHRTMAVYDDSGQVVATEGVVRDISERMTLEARLNQSQKMEAIGRLAGGVAHDFNNMLTVVLGYSGLVLQNIRAEDPLKQYVEGIKRASERAAQLTRQLLALGRRHFLLPAVLDLNSVVEDMKGMLSRLIGEHIELVTQLSPQAVRIKADLSQIEQVMLNLVINARDAMLQGGTLTIETASEGPYAVLSVTDTGIGIDSETLQHVFEPFFTTKPEGSGLGLATVQAIVTQSGGEVSVETEVGSGTTFRILIPRTAAPITRILTAQSFSAKSLSHETVLIVEDEDQVRTVTAEVLETEGYRVLQAKTAAEARLMYQTTVIPIDLLLTDLVLTDMDGVELAARISAMNRGTAVLYMSGYSDKELIKFGNFDVRMFIQKPLNPKTLAEKVRQTLDSRSPGSI